MPCWRPLRNTGRRRPDEKESPRPENRLGQREGYAMQKLAYAAGPRNSTSALSWNDVERITGGCIGATVQARCPLCSDFRSTNLNRRSKCLGVQRRSEDYAVFNCLNCGAHGNVFRDDPPPVIDFAERQRQRDLARKRDEAQKQQRVSAAGRIWDSRQPFRNSPAEDYIFDTRRIGDWLDVFPYLDEVFGYHPECPWDDGTTRPAMLALIRNIHTDKPQGVHRTSLLPLQGEKRPRLSKGLVSGGAIKISPDHDVHSGLLIGEGIESGFSLSQILKYRPIWSLIDRINLGNFPVLPAIEHLVIAADNDQSGDGQRDAEKTAERWFEAGRDVDLHITDEQGDFNDLLLNGATG